jgi:hypothetical protein
MTASKSSDSRQRSSSRIACYGTAFLRDALTDAAVLKHGVALDMPQFSSPRMDASFLINCGRFLAGRLLTGKVATAEDPSTHVKRVACTDFRSPKAAVIYECSTELRELLAALTGERAAEMATDWSSLYGPQKAKPAEPNGRTQRRLSILTILIDLAKRAKVGNKALMLRVEYRKHR